MWTTLSALPLAPILSIPSGLGLTGNLITPINSLQKKGEGRVELGSAKPSLGGGEKNLNKTGTAAKQPSEKALLFVDNLSYWGLTTVGQW